VCACTYTYVIYSQTCWVLVLSGVVLIQCFYRIFDALSEFVCVCVCVCVCARACVRVWKEKVNSLGFFLLSTKKINRSKEFPPPLSQKQSLVGEIV